MLNKQVIVLILVSTSLFLILTSCENANSNFKDNHIVPGIMVDNSIYYISSYNDSTISTLPIGFEEQGVINKTNEQANYVNGSTYYTNSEYPNWVYVYCKTWDEKNIETLAYVRFVSGIERWNTLLLYNNTLYAELEQLTFYDGINSKDTAYKLHLLENYSPRVDALPENYCFKGELKYINSDCLPINTNDINNPEYNNSSLYVNDDNADIIYVSTSWHTSNNDESEIVHDGFSTFVKYPDGETSEN